MSERSLRRYTADLVVLAGAPDDPLVLVCVRGVTPHLGSFVLPGGHVEADETAAAAAVRELAEETGLVLGPAEIPVLLGVADAPGRDARGPVVSAVYMVRIEAPRAVRGGDDAAEATWVPVSQLRAAGMGFDHLAFVEAAAGWLPRTEPPAGAGPTC